MRRLKTTGLWLAATVFIAGGCSTARDYSKGTTKRGLSSEAKNYLAKKGGSLPQYDIPIEINDRVLAEIRRFTADKKRFKLYLERSGRYEKWMKNILAEEGVPQDLFYLALIESGFSNHALSHAAALGPWQFIRSTGRIFGLKHNFWIDERKNPEKATRAAARYLKNLYNEFDDWYLAMAGYNAGEGKVRRAIRDANSRNFWVISAHGTRYLKQETQDYVPRFIAAALVAKSPEKFGMYNLAYDVDYTYENVKVKGPLDLSVAAKLTGISTGQMVYLNPELIQYRTPPGTYALNIPVGTRSQFLANYAKLPPSERRVEMMAHRVQRGDTLSQLAGRYGVSVRKMMEANNMGGRQAHRLRVGAKLIVPKREGGEITYYSSSRWRTSYYRVRRGDNLIKIARRYGVSVASIKKKNRLRNNQLSVGKRLKITYRTKVREPVMLAYNPPKKDQSTSQKLDGVEWLIRQEEEQNPSPVIEAKKRNAEEERSPLITEEILDKKGMAYAENPRFEEIDLRKRGAEEVILGDAGGVKIAPRYVEQEIAKVVEPKYYKVRRGDNLWHIAKKHNVTVAELKKWNSIRDNKIDYGQRLRLTPLSESLVMAAQYTPKSEKVKRHVVRRGDNLWQISRKYGLTVAQLKKWNDLEDNDLRPGKRLRLTPKAASKPTVEAGAPTTDY